MIKKLSRHVFNFVDFIENSQPAFILFLEMLIGIILTLGSFILFIKLRGEVFEVEASSFDTLISNFLFTIRSPLLNYLMLAVTNFGGELMVILGILFVAFLLLKKHKREAFLFCFIPGMGIIIDNILKILIQRPRPTFYPLIILNTYSFPSGHAMDSFVFYMTFSYLVYHITRSKLLTLFSFCCSTILILIIGLSRIYLGVHYPTDVLAGYLGGFCWFLSVLLIQRTIIFYELFKERDKISKA